MVPTFQAKLDWSASTIYSPYAQLASQRHFLMNLLGSMVFVSLFKFFNPEETFTLTGEVKSQAAPWHTKQTGSEPLGLGLEAQYSHSGPEILQKPWKMLDCCFKNTFQRKVVVSLSNNASFH